MHGIYLLVFIVYFAAMLGVGLYFFRSNKSNEDYYVGGRSMGPWHIGLSVVATDVGGGFSIGLGGLGFLMGLSGSWMLFTGLIGAWLSAVLLIPRVKAMSSQHSFLTFPQLFSRLYSSRVALVAGIISAIGYTGFASSQLLAGAKLASATFTELTLHEALLAMGVIAVSYTVFGGLKAVIYTDTIQWIILMAGLVGIGIPLGYLAVGGYSGIQAAVDPKMLHLNNISWSTMVNWAVTIIPIWFVGMTLYQRIYASRDERTAKRAWFIAGLFEYPIMAFMGVALGLFARVAADQGMFGYLGFHEAAGMDEEMGLPLLLRTILPVGLTGLMLSAYFSAIMSTADSCLMAASGNVVTDILNPLMPQQPGSRQQLRFSQWATLLIGGLSLGLALFMKNVLSLMLLSYAFMVSGLLVPVVGGLFWKRGTPAAALASMISGGCTTLLLVLLEVKLPWELDANIAGLSISALSYIVLSLLNPSRNIQARDDHSPTQLPVS